MAADTQERQEQLSVPMSFRVPPEIARRIRAEAAREMLSNTAFVRRAVLQSLALSAPEGL